MTSHSFNVSAVSHVYWLLDGGGCRLQLAITILLEILALVVVAVVAVVAAITYLLLVFLRFPASIGPHPRLAALQFSCL